MYDVIYVPLGDNEEVKKRRQETVLEFVKQGWAMHGNIELKDALGNSVQVQVLMRP